MTDEDREARISAFREDVLKLYNQHRDHIEALSKKHGVEVYESPKPSHIPQPKFVVDGIEVDMDTLYNEEEFELLLSSRLLKRGRVGPV